MEPWLTSFTDSVAVPRERGSVLISSADRMRTGGGCCEVKVCGLEEEDHGLKLLITSSIEGDRFVLVVVEVAAGVEGRAYGVF